MLFRSLTVVKSQLSSRKEERLIYQDDGLAHPHVQEIVQSLDERVMIRSLQVIEYVDGDILLQVISSQTIDLIVDR